MGAPCMPGRSMQGQWGSPPASPHLCWHGARLERLHRVVPISGGACNPPACTQQFRATSSKLGVVFHSPLRCSAACPAAQPAFPVAVGAACFACPAILSSPAVCLGMIMGHTQGFVSVWEGIGQRGHTSQSQPLVQGWLRTRNWGAWVRPASALASRLLSQSGLEQPAFASGGASSASKGSLGTGRLPSAGSVVLCLRFPGLRRLSSFVNTPNTFSKL